MTKTGSISISNDTVYVTDFEVSDPELASFLKGQPNPVEAFTMLVNTATRILGIANSSTEGLLLRAAVESAQTVVTDLARDLLDPENGQAHVALIKFKNDFEALLKDSFDAEKQSSIMAKFNKLFEKSVTALDDSIAKALDPLSEDSPMSRVRKSFVDAVGDLVDPLSKDLVKIRDRLEGRGNANERAGVGRELDQYVDSLVQIVAQERADWTLYVGNTTGKGNSKSGDQLVRINLDDTFGQDVRFVWECKAGKKITPEKLAQELDLAMINRDAVAAIGVRAINLSSDGPGEEHVQFIETGTNKAYLYLDFSHERDERVNLAALRLAYTWGRWMSRRQHRGGDVKFDTGVFRAHLQTATAALKNLIELRKQFTNIQSAVLSAQDWTLKLEADLKSSLESMEEMLKVSDSSD